jgi:hypothetical protein
MELRERLAQHCQPFEAVLAVASCRDSLGFADLLWPPLDFDAFRDRLIANRDPGVIFETATRVVVVEEHGGELRFYAGGWGSAVYDEPNELGMFRSPGGVIWYAEAFLVRQLHPQQIAVRRGILSAAYEWGRPHHRPPLTGHANDRSLHSTARRSVPGGEMPDRRFHMDWSSLTREGNPPRQDVAALLDGIATYRAPPGLEEEWGGFEFPYQDLVAVYPELVPHLIPRLLEIAGRPDYQGRWRVLSLVMETNEPGWEAVFERAGDTGLGERIRCAFLAGQPVYLRCLDDPEPRTREMAACALGECATPEAVAALKGRLSQESEADVRRYLRAWLKRAGLPPDDPIFTAVPDDGPWVPPQRDPDDELPF